MKNFLGAARRIYRNSSLSNFLPNDDVVVVVFGVGGAVAFLPDLHS